MMTNINTEPAKVVTFVRDGLIENKNISVMLLEQIRLELLKRLERIKIIRSF